VTEGSEPSEEASAGGGSVVVDESVPAGEPGAPAVCPEPEEDLDAAAGPVALPPALVVDPGCAAELLAEVPETDEGEPPADASGPGTVAVGASALPAAVEPAEPAVGVLPLQAVSTTASTRKEAVSQRDRALAALAPNCPNDRTPR
jgi:hypothetical protein